MTDAEDAPAEPDPQPMNRAARRAAGKSAAPTGPKINSRSGQMRQEREAQARSAAKHKPQLRK